MWRRALVLASVALAGCGGGSGDGERGERRAAPDRDERPSRFVTGEVRTPDARTPLVQGHGLWSCETTGRVELRVEPGRARDAVHARPAARLGGARPARSSTAPASSSAGKRLPPFRAAHSIAGESHLRCDVPGTVLVDMRDGDLTVREPGRARFLLGAAVSDEHLEAAGHWSADCELASGG